MDIPIAVCFFGIVKLRPEVLTSIQNKIFNVLKDHEMSYHVYLHTYPLKEMTNKRNGEYKIPLIEHAWKKLKPDFWAVTDQSDFDKTIELSNYLKIGDPWPESKGNSLMNHLRSLNSQRMVSSLWCSNHNKYKCVIFLRPDLIYIDPLDMNAVREVVHTSRDIPVVYTPSWAPGRYCPAGGYNDRLAIGTPKGMRFYGNRLGEAEMYTKMKPLHSETYLKHTLDSRNVRHKILNMRAARVRANGMVADFKNVLYDARISMEKGAGIPDRWTPNLTRRHGRKSAWSSPQFQNMKTAMWRKY